MASRARREYQAKWVAKKRERVKERAKATDKLAGRMVRQAIGKMLPPRKPAGP